MDWTKNLLSYEKNKEKGICPKCSSKSIEVEELNYGQRKTLFFKCNDCNAATHFEGFIAE